MFNKQTNNYHTFNHNVDHVDPLFRNIQRDFINENGELNVINFGYILMGTFVVGIAVILLVVLL